MRLADALLEQAAYHRLVAHDFDMRPEDTINWQHFIDCGNAAAELRRLHALNEELLEALKTAKWMLERDYIDDQKMRVIEKCDALIDKAEAQA